MAGKPLKGHLLVQVDKSCQGSDIRLTVYGKELSMLYSESRQLRRAEKCFYETTHTIACPQQRLMKNTQRILPFQILLPESLPGSTSFPPNVKSTSFRKGMHIRYTMVAELGTLREEISFTCQSTCLPGTPVPCLIQPKSFSISTIAQARKCDGDGQR